MRGAALIIAVSMLLSRVLGVAREMLLARMVGVGPEKNAFDLAFMVPDMVNNLVSTGFQTFIFIPIFTGYIVAQKEEDAWRFFSNILNSLGLLLLVLTLPAWIWMKEILVHLTSANLDPQILERAVYYARIILPAQLAFFAGSFLVAVQHTRKQFFFPAFTGLIYNAAIIVGGVLWPGTSVEGFVWGVPVGAFVGFIALQIWSGHRGGGLHWKALVWLKDPDIRRYFAMLLPLMLGVGAMFALEFVIRAFGSQFGGQGISSLNYAYRVMYTLVAVFGFSVGVAGYPDMSRLAKEGKLTELHGKVLRSLDRMLSILVPAIAMVWVLSFPIVRILFERGAFTREATLMVSELLRWYLPVALAMSTQAVLVRSFYAQERMWLPTLVNTGIFLASIPVYGALASRMGIYSVPIVGSVSAILQVLALLVIRGKVILGEQRFGFVQSIASLLVIAVGAYLVGDLPIVYFSHTPLLHTILVAGALGIAVFLGTLGIQIALGSSTARELLGEKILRRKINT